MPRIKVTINCVADRYVSPSRERIIEFSDPETDGPKGGLISFTRLNNGKLHVRVYRTDPGVEVSWDGAPSPPIHGEPK